jgi:hypothetical protein
MILIKLRTRLESNILETWNFKIQSCSSFEEALLHASYRPHPSIRCTFFPDSKSLAAAPSSITSSGFQKLPEVAPDQEVSSSLVRVGSTLTSLVFGNPHSILCLRFLTPSKMEAVTVVELDTILTFRKNDFILFIQASKYGLYINQKNLRYTSFDAHHTDL